MRFKVDENLPVELADLLMGLGHDARTVNDEHLQGVNDPRLMETCDREQRILVTLGVDFSDIRAYPPPDHEGIIVLRVGNQSKPHVLEVFGRTCRSSDRNAFKAACGWSRRTWFGFVAKRIEQCGRRNMAQGTMPASDALLTKWPDQKEEKGT